MPHVCPWWLAYTFDHPIRRMLLDPVDELRAYVQPGARALDIGCGLGFHAVALCAVLGPQGSLVIADVQQQMLDRALRRCSCLLNPPAISTALVTGSDMPWEGAFDFTLLYWSLHEVKEQAALWGNLAHHVAPRGCALVAEPRVHISRKTLLAEMGLAQAAGFDIAELPSNLLSHRAIARSTTTPRSE
jgi:ubiquinone/menaquinone biosynthesis C-methylase UbiE